MTVTVTVTVTATSLTVTVTVTSLTVTVTVTSLTATVTYKAKLVEEMIFELMLLRPKTIRKQMELEQILPNSTPVGPLLFELILPMPKVLAQ